VTDRSGGRGAEASAGAAQHRDRCYVLFRSCGGVAALIMISEVANVDNVPTWIEDQKTENEE